MRRLAPARVAAWLREARHRSTLASGIGLVLLGTASWLYTHWDLPWLLRSGDAKEYAVMARRLATGQGFSTSVVFPAELSFGVSSDRPAVVRPPLWPLLLAAPFRISGPSVSVTHLAVLACHILAIAAAGWIAARLAGRAAGAIAAVATAVTPQFVVFTVDGLSEPLFAAWIAIAFWLCARGAGGFAIGLAAGLGYLTRYNGVVLLPALLLFLLLERRRLSPLLGCGAGFLAVAVPWWIRNWAVTGDPLYTLLSLNLYFDPGLLGPRSSLLYTLDPDAGIDSAAEFLDKALDNLGLLLRRFPLAAANLSACLGVALACLRRDPSSLAFALAVAATTAGIALALPNGRYFAPFVPVLSALGAAGWMRFGGRLRVPMLALLLAAPVLPGPVRDLPDVALLRAGIPRAREAARQKTGQRRAPETDLDRCLDAGMLVVTYAAAELAWETRAIAIYQPSRPADFWRIVQRYPVRYVQVGDPGELGRGRFEAHFVRQPECGPDLYRRRESLRSAPAGS